MHTVPVSFIFSIFYFHINLPVPVHSIWRLHVIYFPRSSLQKLFSNTGIFFVIPLRALPNLSVVATGTVGHKMYRYSFFEFYIFSPLFFLLISYFLIAHLFCTCCGAGPFLTGSEYFFHPLPL